MKMLPKPIREMTRHDLLAILIIVGAVVGALAWNALIARLQTPDAPWWTWLLP